RLRRLGGGGRVGRLPPPALLVVLGQLVARAGGDGLGLLVAGERRHPGDFWLCFTLANLLYEKGRPGEAVGYYRAALAVRPDSSVTYSNLGNALRASKDLAGAVASF